MAKVFLCYRREDAGAHAGRVKDWLERSLGTGTLFMDVDNIPLGKNFAKVLREEVAQCAVLLAFIGRNWLDARDESGKRRLDSRNDFVRIEIRAALQRDVPVVPILLDGTKIPSANQLPKELEELSFRQGIDLHLSSFSSDIDRLIQGLRSHSEKVAPIELQHSREQAAPSDEQLERFVGYREPQTYQWWKAGLERVRSVALIRQKLRGRIGTGFLVRAASLGLQPPDELLVLTSFCVVNESGASIGIYPGDAEVVFEAVDTNKAYSVSTLLWSSPIISCDASVLRLQEPAMGISPMPLAETLPIVQPGARVYIVGHLGGRDLALSDAELLDHEGPPGGNPQINGVSRVHYWGATEPGSAGSPVLNSRWEVIAVHHMGLKESMPRLNGKDGSYAAKEGISILSIKAAIFDAQMGNTAD